MNVDDIRKVLIVGAGSIGRQITLQCAMHGYQVIMYDILPQALAESLVQIKQFATELTAEGRLTTSGSAAALARISTTQDPAEAG